MLFATLLSVHNQRVAGVCNENKGKQNTKAQRDYGEILSPGKLRLGLFDFFIFYFEPLERYTRSGLFTVYRTDISKYPNPLPRAT
jgi:hypothetical protein